MTVVSAAYNGTVSGSSSSYANGTFTANGVGINFSVYLSDSQSTNGLINVGDNITYYLDFGGGDVESHPGIFKGYYLQNGVEYPFFYSNTYNQYYLAGQSNTGAYAITAAPDDQVSCFASGTRVRVARGDTAGEGLRIGDVAVTASGARRAIRWLGQRTIDCRNHPRPQDVLPICISSDAFGENRPARDLFVSPGHAICVDVLGEVLIPAIALVNGATIRQADVDEVTYWHVELDSHDVILAENLPAESYLDMGNREFFKEADVVDLAAAPDPSRRTHADFCRPFHADGALVDVVRAQMRKRAEAAGWRLSSAIEMHLEVDGQRLDPVVRGLSARFQIPADAKDVWLVSPTARPYDMTGSGDTRLLGLCLRALRLDDGFEVRDVALDDPSLGAGFHEVEDGRRWTAGRARLPAALWDGCAVSVFLCVELAGPPVPRWSAPVVERPQLAIVA